MSQRKKSYSRSAPSFLLALMLFCFCWSAPLWAQTTGDLGVIIERNAGSVVIINTTHHSVVNRVENLGNLSHATGVYSRDARYFYTFQRDGWINKIELLTGKVVAQKKAGDNAIGGAISQDGRFIAISNYKPGDIKILSSDDLKILKVIPAHYTDGEGVQKQSRTVGLVDAPNHRFLFSLMDAGQIWMVDTRSPDFPVIQQWEDVGNYPYDALMTADGRYYITGFLRSNWVVRLDLWDLEKGPTQVSTLDPNLNLPKVPMYKVPHLSGWGLADGKAFTPMISEERLMVYDAKDWAPQESVKTYGTVVFAVPRPDQREIWLSFAGPKNDTLQIMDVPSQKPVKQLKLGKSISHIQFTPRGEAAYVSVRGTNQVVVFDAYTHEEITRLSVDGPSGIFFTNRAHIIGL